MFCSLSEFESENFQNVFGSLEWFDVSFNSLTTQPSNLLHSLPELIYLNLSHNNIDIAYWGRSWPLLTNANLQVLDLSHNRISQLDRELFNGLHNLTKLYLDNNIITIFTTYYFQFAKKITTISMNYNNITNIYFPFAYDMLELNMVGNRFNFTNFSVPFERAPELQTLRLGRPGLNYYPVTLKYVKNLKHLFLKDFSQPILSSELFLEQKILETIEVEAGDVQSITFERMNFITNLRFQNLPNLAFFSAIDCKKLGRGSIKLSNVSNLTNVAINGLIELTNIKSFLYAGVSNSIKYLNLSNNSISRVTPSDFQNLTKLEVLDLSFNIINFIHPNSFTTLMRLKSVNFTQNHLLELSNSFLMSSSVVYLAFSHNRIQSVSACWECDLPNLRAIDLSFNKIRSLPKMSKSNTFFSLSLEGNSWSCTCTLLSNLAPSKLDTLCDSNSTNCLKCSSPLKYLGKTLHDLVIGCKELKEAEKHSQSQPPTWVVVILCVVIAIILLLSFVATIYICKMCRQRRQNNSCFKNVFSKKK